MFLAAAAESYSPEMLRQIGWFLVIAAGFIPASVPIGMRFVVGAFRLDLFIAVVAQCSIMGWSLTAFFNRLRARGDSDRVILVKLTPAYVLLCLGTNIVFFLLVNLLQSYR
jgi:hypothetical protein